MKAVNSLASLRRRFKRADSRIGDTIVLLAIMEEVFRTTDPVRLSYAVHLLSEANIDHFVADEYISAVEGSIGAFPRRILVHDSDLARARTALHELRVENG